jgi:hypothetical protein
MTNNEPMWSEQDIAERRRMYTDPDGIFQKSGRGAELLGQFEARIEAARIAGHLPPAPEPFGPKQVLAQQFASEFPTGEAGNFFSDGLIEMLDQRGEQFRAMKYTEKQIADMADHTAKDLASDIGPYSGEYNRETGQWSVVTGHTRLAELLAAAEPMLADLDADQRKVTRDMLKSDRRLLELYAAKGQRKTAYTARKKALGL